MNDDLKTQPQPLINYAAHILRRLTDVNATDPGAEDFKRLDGPLFELVMNVYSEGTSKDKRRSRLKAEMSARGLDLVLQPLIELADPQADLSSLELGTGWRWFSLGDVRKEVIPPIEWVAKYFLSKPAVTIFFGKPKAKKSLLVLDLCFAIARGQAWMLSGPETIDGIEVTQSRVAWIDLENGPRTLKKRIMAFDKAFGLSTPPNGFMAVSMPSPHPDLSKPENVILLIEYIRALGDVDVCVFDHLNLLFGSLDENTSLVSQIMNSIRQVSEACNVGIILLHHAKKGGQKDSGSPDDMLRGSGSILAGVDGAFLVETDLGNRDRVTVTPVAVRGPDAPNISANFVYEQDASSLDLTSARFWRVEYKNKSARAQDAIIQALKENGSLNNTALRAAAKRIDRGLTDTAIREGIATLEGVREISFTKASKGAKIYRLGGMYEENDEG